MPGNVATFTLGPFAAGNAASIVAANTPAGAGNLAIVGGAPFLMDAPRRVLITFGNEGAPRVIKISGTVAGPQGAISGGNAITETRTIPSGAPGTLATIQDFATVTAVQVFAAWTTNMSVGTVGTAAGLGKPIGATPWFEVDINRIPVNVSIAVARLDAAGALATGYTIEATLDDPNAGYDNLGVISIPSSNNPQSNVPPLVFADGASLGQFGAQAGALKTGNAIGALAQPVWALRAALYDATPAQLSVQFIQAGILGA